MLVYFSYYHTEYMKYYYDEDDVAIIFHLIF